MARIGGSLVSGGKGAESTRMAAYRMEQCFACVKSKDFRYPSSSPRILNFLGVSPNKKTNHRRQVAGSMSRGEFK
jgi:hypothetical protein